MKVTTRVSARDGIVSTRYQAGGRTLLTVDEIPGFGFVPIEPYRRLLDIDSELEWPDGAEEAHSTARRLAPVLAARERTARRRYRFAVWRCRVRDFPARTRRAIGHHWWRIRFRVDFGRWPSV